MFPAILDWPHCLTWDGNYIWCADGDWVYDEYYDDWFFENALLKIEPTQWTVVLNVPVDVFYTDVTYNGESIWCYDYEPEPGESYVYEHDVSDGHLIGKYQVIIFDNVIRGIACDGDRENMWCLDDKSFYTEDSYLYYVNPVSGGLFFKAKAPTSYSKVAGNIVLGQ